MRRPTPHAVMLPDTVVNTVVNHCSAFRTKPRSVGSWDLTTASLPRNCQEQPCSKLWSSLRSSTHSKSGLSGCTKTWPFWFNGHPSPELSMNLTADPLTRYSTVQPLTFFSAQSSSFTLVPHVPEVLIPSVVTSWVQVSEQKLQQQKNKTPAIKTSASQGIFPREPYL